MMIKKLKFAYQLYNFFHRKELIHNLKHYKKYGLKKNYFSSISSDDFSNITSHTELKSVRKQNLKDLTLYKNSDALAKSSLEQFDEQGYCFIKNFLNPELVNAVNQEIATLVSTGALKFKNRNKLMFAIDKSTFLNDVFDDKDFNQLLNYLIQGQSTLFQSINFLTGSEQKTHSDSIHMTTFPLGGLLGVWIALENITLENGPIHYYPKSHKLPYYMNRDYDNQGSKFFLGNKGYGAYEELIQSKLEEGNIKKEVFLAEPGDLFIWHANLLHGGEPLIDKKSSRKSMVLHYYDAARICYHEITQRPTLIKRNKND